MVSSRRTSLRRWRATYLAIRAMVYGVMLSTFFGSSSAPREKTTDGFNGGCSTVKRFHQSALACGNVTCQATDELLLPVLVEQVRTEDQLQAPVAHLSGARRQHLIEQRHLLVTNPSDARQRVFDQTQNLPDSQRKS